jgi:hypothetical protein
MAWTGSGQNQVMASFITGGFFLLVFLVLFLYRKKLFVNGFVRLFSKLFLEEKDPNAREEIIYEQQKGYIFKN